MRDQEDLPVLLFDGVEGLHDLEATLFVLSDHGFGPAYRGIGKERLLRDISAGGKLPPASSRASKRCGSGPAPRAKAPRSAPVPDRGSSLDPGSGPDRLFQEAQDRAVLRLAVQSGLLQDLSPGPGCFP